MIYSCIYYRLLVFVCILAAYAFKLVTFDCQNSKKHISNTDIFFFFFSETGLDETFQHFSHLPTKFVLFASMKAL